MAKALFIIAFILLAADNTIAMTLCETGTCQTDAAILKTLIGTVGGYGIGGQYSYRGTWNWYDTGIGIPGTASGETGCFAYNNSSTGNGGHCWCRVTQINDNVCNGRWIYLAYYNVSYCLEICAVACGCCIRYDAHNSCTREKMFTNI